MQRCLALYTAEHMKMNPEFYSMLERAFHSQTLWQRLWACPARTCGPARRWGGVVLSALERPSVDICG